MAIEAIFNTPHTGMLVCDQNGYIEAINKHMAKILGKPANKLKGERLYKYLDKTNADLLSGYLQANSDDVLFIQLKSQESPENKQKLKISASGEGENRLFSGIASPLPTSQEQQQKYQAELDELRSQFLSIASHELKLPLAGLLSSLNLIERYLHSAGEEWNRFSYKDKVEKHLITFKTSIRNLQNIINEFLSINNIEQGKIQPRYESFNLRRFLHKHQKYILETLNPKQELIYQCDTCDSEIITDKYFLHSIISNLIFNAIKYSPENSRISLIAKIDGQMLNLQVKDEGIGVPKSEQDKIFGHFYRAKNVINYEGTGLGLTITKKYIDMLGGKISLKSNTNQGSTFIILLPLKS
ncbi:MAG: ATP-binding protein [Bacteroidota bacterium]